MFITEAPSKSQSQLFIQACRTVTAISWSHDSLGALHAQKHASGKGCVIPAPAVCPPTWASQMPLHQTVWLVKNSLMTFKAIVILSILIQLEIGAHTRKRKAFPHLSTGAQGRASMMTSTSWACRGHQFSLSCTVPVHRCPGPESRRKELPAETSLAQKLQTQQGGGPRPQ